LLQKYQSQFQQEVAQKLVAQLARIARNTRCLVALVKGGIEISALLIVVRNPKLYN
jgi:hypothetical protein